VLYARLARLHRPIGILLLLWPMLWALWMAAGGVPNFDVLVIFVLGTVLMRSAGCVINDYADRNFDGHVERTRNAPSRHRRGERARGLDRVRRAARASRRYWCLRPIP
jgi:4-hydroxybenzoate polyprenyltransferase